MQVCFERLFSTYTGPYEAGTSSHGCHHALDSQGLALQDKYEKAVDKARTQQQAAAEAAAQKLQKTTEEAAHKLEAATTEAAQKLAEVKQLAQRASEAAQRTLQDTQARPCADLVTSCG